MINRTEGMHTFYVKYIDWTKDDTMFYKYKILPSIVHWCDETKDVSYDTWVVLPNTSENLCMPVYITHEADAIMFKLLFSEYLV